MSDQTEWDVWYLPVKLKNVYNAYEILEAAFF